MILRVATLRSYVGNAILEVSYVVVTTLSEKPVLIIYLTKMEAADSPET